MAATFVNLDSGEAVRIVPTESARDQIEVYAPEIDDRHRQHEA